MKKNLLLLSCFFLQNMAAQKPARCDTIYFRDGRVVAAEVEKTERSEVVWSPCSAESDATYASKTSTILKIRYRNGNEKTFDLPAPNNDGNTTADPPGPKPVFGYVTFSGGFPSGGEVSLNVLFGKGYSLSLFTSSRARNSKNVPADYNGGLCIFGDCDEIQQILFTTGITFGKTFPTDIPKMRWNLKGGLGAGTFKWPDDFRRVPTPFLGSNYEYTLKKATTFSLVLQPTLEWTLSRYFGLGFSFFANVNKHWTIAGINFNLHAGYLRDRIK